MLSLLLRCGYSQLLTTVAGTTYMARQDVVLVPWFVHP